MFMAPYVGVTGFMHRHDVCAAIEVLNRLCVRDVRNQRRLMVGVLASSKTIAGIPNKWPKRYPMPEKIASLFLPDRRTVNLIHYATDDQGTLKDQLLKLVKLGGQYFDGFQLNMAWPEPRSIQLTNHLRMVLQLGNRALTECGDDPKTVAKRLKEYNHVDQQTSVITDVLIDGSCGHGTPLDAEKTEAYIAAITESCPNLGIGVAGGLSAETLGSIKPLLKKYPRLSFDAEGMLRDADDHLDRAKTDSYIKDAYQLFR